MMVLKDSSYGMVVSTADHFTYRAYEAINKARAKGMRIELIDRGKLNRMLDSVLPYRPWLSILRERCPEDAGYFAEAIQVPDPNQLILPYT